ncbi:ubiquitin-related modifier 1 [Eremomyces bilateralis CBS 781.70]|uniref:Ubiquitin-related modifier 1 n=1 Tax=Eremomyces bilateralis CBS 781.70 TaxID=1392243 RepID=A0A6G1FRJ1_9PEZI|nr:ubiquitin-related modifier 1 [Eremomyces bilateralis CBS 781.70]KAF1808282.1 ubiquitin-related modifier 1 [Eremomyces bilateralis CBS 781.70]
MADTGDNVHLTVEFSGGLEMLFSNRRKHSVSLPKISPKGTPVTIDFLVKYLCDHLMKDSRKDLFIMEDNVRPGILVLINDSDWELEGEADYEIQPNDNIMFVSTLHGG